MEIVTRRIAQYVVRNIRAQRQHFIYLVHQHVAGLLHYQLA